MGRAVGVAAGHGVKDEHLLFDRQRLVLPLLQELGHAGAAGELLLRRLVEVRAELREGRQLAILRQLQAELAGHLLHGGDLGGATDAAHRDAGVHGRPLPRVEEVALEEDLPVGDGDDVGRDVGRHVAGLRLDDRQRRQRARAFLVGQLGRALEQARVQVEDVARVGLASRRAAQEQRELPVGDRLLRKIVVDDEGVAAAVPIVLGHGDAGVGREELQRRRLRSRGGDDRRVLDGARLAQLVDDRGHRRLLLADGDVEAANVLALLVDDGVDGHGRLAGLAVADDELALTAADRDHRVDGLDAGLHRLVHRLTGDDAGRLHLDLAALGGGDGALAVDRDARARSPRGR